MSQFCFTWHNINVTIVEKSETFWKTTSRLKVILDNVSGFATSNSLYAIVGSSGSGKTSLLRAISGRCRLKSGVLQINKRVFTDADIRDISGYVPQQDIFTEYLTVSEYMQFMTALQLNSKNNKSQIKELLSEVCLDGHNSSWIKNLSTGEKRRLTLAGELISDPFILFCDEPTTGLDSYNSLLVIEKLQKRALGGKIVLATIHQPSSQIFHYFDNITLLAEGKLVFQGTREEANSFFASMNLKCPLNYNPADFYIKCLTFEDVSEMCEIFKRQKTRPTSYNDAIVLEKKYKSTFCNELKWLLWRSFLSTKRNTAMYLGGYLLVLIELFLITAFYSDISLSTLQSPQDIEGFLGLFTSELIFTNMYAVVSVFPREIDVFVREKTLYSGHAYYISKLLSTVPIVLISTTLYMSIIFALLKFLNGVYLWLQMTYWMFTVSIAACALGLAFSGSFSTVEHIDLYLGPIEFLLLLLSGLMVKLDKIPVGLSWLKYLSPFYYAFESSSNLLWEKVSNIGNCTERETLPCYSNGTEVLQSYGVYRTYSGVYNVLYLHILTVIFIVIGFVGLVRKKNVHTI